MPESATAGEFEALLVKVMLPAAAPAPPGANRAVNELDCPTFSVSGRVNPVVLNPAPPALEAVIVRLALPVFVSVTDWLAVFPTITLPKLMLVGFGVRTPAGAGVPFPESEITLGEFVALLARETFPLTAPVAPGANVAVKVED